MSQGFVASRQKLKVHMFYKMIKEGKGKGVCKTDGVDLKQIFTESNVIFCYSHMVVRIHYKGRQEVLSMSETVRP